MDKPKFNVGDVISHDDGSVYVISEYKDYTYVCVTIYESQGIYWGRYRGHEYSMAVKELWTKIGHVDISDWGVTNE